VSRDIEVLDRVHQTPTDIWSDGKTVWALDHAASGADRVFASEINGCQRMEASEFEFDRCNRFLHGIWSYGDTLFAVDEQDRHILSYNMPDATQAWLARSS